jgi:hypothetical protein
MTDAQVGLIVATPIIVVFAIAVFCSVPAL